MNIYRLATITAIALSTALMAAPPGAPTSQPQSCRARPTASQTCKASGRRPAPRQPIFRITLPASTCWRAGRWSPAAKSRISRGPPRRGPRIFRTGRRPIRSRNATCPGVPRIMYLDFPFQIFQTPKAIAMAFEWELDYRLIYTDGTPHPTDADFWMGDSRGHWEGDTLVVDVSNINDKTWFDMAGDFHSDALHVVERYRMTRPRHDSVRSDHRGFEGLHQALDHQHRLAPANGSGQAFRVLLPVRSRRGERRVHA